jgi:hypothetical protein
LEDFCEIFLEPGEQGVPFHDGAADNLLAGGEEWVAAVGRDGGKGVEDRWRFKTDVLREEAGELPRGIVGSAGKEDEAAGFQERGEVADFECHAEDGGVGFVDVEELGAGDFAEEGGPFEAGADGESEAVLAV